MELVGRRKRFKKFYKGRSIKVVKKRLLAILVFFILITREKNIYRKIACGGVKFSFVPIVLLTFTFHIMHPLDAHKQLQSF